MKYNYINPKHYKQFANIECWEMMLKLWGKEKFIAYCEMNAFKYRMRLGEKPEQPIDRDLAKANWYMNKANELK